MTCDVIQGGCSCGAVRYEYRGAAVLDMNCHCRECQFASGSGYGAFRVLWLDQFRLLKGAPKYYAKGSDAGSEVSREFCQSCGSPLTFRTAYRPKLILITAASLDDPSAYAPTMNIFTSSAPHWDVMDESIERHDRAPPYPDGFGL